MFERERAGVRVAEVIGAVRVAGAIAFGGVTGVVGTVGLARVLGVLAVVMVVETAPCPTLGCLRFCPRTTPAIR